MYGILNDPSADKYSRLNEMDQFRNKGDGNRFTFALRYPEHDLGRYYEWKQQVNPFGVEGKMLLSIFNKMSRMLPYLDFSDCYVMNNTDFRGKVTFSLAGVHSLEDCRTLCRTKNIKNFVWVRCESSRRCLCKETATGESSNTCRVSGHAAGSTCMSENFTTGEL